MKSVSTYLLKDRRCGNCNFTSQFEIILYPEEMLKLRNATQKILSSQQDGCIKSDDIIDILTCIETFKNKKCYCKREKIWTHFLDVACSLWQPRKNSLSKKDIMIESTIST